ncbi:MAG: ABC transporter permease subunit, partial [Tateyamaria sp.]
MTDTAPIDPYAALQDKEPPKAPRSQWKDVWDQFKHHKGALFGGGFLIFITLAVLVGPWVWQVDPQKLDIRNKDLRPIYTAIWDSTAAVRWGNPLGTDNLGRDILANLIAGGRASMAVGWAAMVLALLIGTAVGVVSGYFKKADFWLMRFTDLVLSLPILPLLLVAVTLFRQPLRANFGPEGGMFILIVGVIGLTSWMQTARIVRGDILALKEREFILAA